MTHNAAELCSTVFRLVPLEDEPLRVRGAGHYAHAAFLRQLAQTDPELAQSLHDSGAAKPFTLALIRPRYGPNGGLLLRATSLSGSVTRALGQIAPTDGGGMAPIVSLGSAHYSLLQDDGQPSTSSWHGTAAWDELAAPGSNIRKATISFTSPTAFSFGKRMVILPQPELVFGSLLKRWNTFSPHQLPVDFLRLFSEQLVVSEVRDLQTRMLDYGRYKEKGFTGQVTFEALSSWSDDELSALGSLSEFAFYSGVGYKTTMGMGQSRRVRPQRRIDNAQQPAT